MNAIGEESPSRVLEQRFGTLRRVDGAGMASLFSAEAPDGGGRVAIRVFEAEWGVREQTRTRFTRQLEQLALLSHPALPRVIDHGCTPEHHCFVVTPWLEGTDLRSALAAGRYGEPEDVAALLWPVAAALDLLHGCQILHRTLSPSKIRLIDGERNPAVVLTGLGADKLVAPEEEESGRPTARTAPPGHLSYVAPEADRAAESDHRVDIYALATIAFELLAGRVPFPGATTLARALADRQDRQPPTLQSVAKVPYPKAVEEVLACGLAPRPMDRYRSAGAFIGDLLRAGRREPTHGPRGGGPRLTPDRVVEAARFFRGEDARRDHGGGFSDATVMNLDVVELDAVEKLDSIPPEAVRRSAPPNDLFAPPAPGAHLLGPLPLPPPPPPVVDSGPRGLELPQSGPPGESSRRDDAEPTGPITLAPSRPGPAEPGTTGWLFALALLLTLMALGATLFLVLTET